MYNKTGNYGGNMKNFSIIVLFLSIFLFGVSISAGGMYENVDVESEHLTENTRVTVLEQDVVLKKDSQVMFYVKDGVISDHIYTGTLAEQATFIVQDQKLEIPAGTQVWFYESGRFKYTLALSKPSAFRIQGKEVLFTALYDLYQPMGFHENGNIFRGILAEETSFKVQDKIITFIGMSSFSETGQVLSGSPAGKETFIIQGNPIVFPAEKTIFFHKNGSVKAYASLENDTSFLVKDKMVLFASFNRSYQMIEFFENGDVNTGGLAENTVFNVQGRDLMFRELSHVTFYENGSPSKGILLENTLLSVQDKQVLIKGEETKTISFHKNGALSSGYLAVSMTINFEGSSVELAENTFVQFDIQGIMIDYVIPDY
jgi:hypothetical protein